MKTTFENNKLILYPVGRIDTVNASEIEKEIMSAVNEKENSCNGIIIDMKELSYISSAGLRVLLRLRKSVSVLVQLINVSDELYEIFELTGFSEVLFIKKD